MILSQIGWWSVLRGLGALGRSLGGRLGRGLGGRVLGSSLSRSLGGRVLGSSLSRSLGGRVLGSSLSGSLCSRLLRSRGGLVGGSVGSGRGDGGRSLGSHLGGRGLRGRGVLSRLRSLGSRCSSSGLRCPGSLRGSGLLLLVGGEQLALPLGQRLGVTAARGVTATVPGDQALGGPVGNHAGEQADGADRVVVARDRVVDLVRVAVRVQDRHDRDVQL